MEGVEVGAGRQQQQQEEGEGKDTTARMDSLAQEGQKQFDLMAKEAQLPVYGNCYLETLQDLKQGCASLDDEVQSRLALSFTNCYLTRFGWTVYPCASEYPLSSCMENLDSRAASVYASMLTNTLAMCHFLQAQAWHRSTSKAVHRLRETSESVTSQLAEAVESAASLRQEMDAQILESRNALKTAFSEFRESTAEQRGLIVDVFDRVAQLQNLIMGEFSWFCSIVFYVVSVVMMMLVTCSSRTQGARLPALATLTVSLMFERFVVNFILTYHDDSFDLQETIQFGVWVVRRLAVTVCCLLLLHTAIFFSDPLLVATTKLDELTKAAREMRTLILGDTDSGVSTEMNESFSSNSSDNVNDCSGMEECLESLPTELILPTPKEGCGRYCLRTRPSQPRPSNPILEVENTEMFASTVRHLEALSRRKSLTLRTSLIQGDSGGNNSDNEQSIEQHVH
ncbi:hypothetical protein Pmani_011307 [Petrolisthes manimaculis]|uniref:Uncharacterized protein n=1 Tax=Petrolisthes manimaculis TaxID=1843537 RepID=A0AAE1UGB7_9EUCA|nr:hypothetical protein Pmani_011307 [Petrolisthes manimaculis]